MRLDIVFLGLSITSSWGNGHATTYRSLVRALAARGHRVTFLERDVSWYASHRDLVEPPYCRTILYDGLAGLETTGGAFVRSADVVVLGSYVPDGVAAADWMLSRATGITAFYDIDTPRTLAMLADGSCAYLSREQVPRFDLYFSFTGGPVLGDLEQRLGARFARELYCSVDPEVYAPSDAPPVYDLGYLGTWSEDRQDSLERLLLEPARRWPEGRFVVAGAQYPTSIDWPANVERIEHLPPPAHAAFYASQRFTLNLTRADMIRCGWSPSVRLFEAAACATPILSDRWPGLAGMFAPGREIVLVDHADQVLGMLRRCHEHERREIGRAARLRVLARHTSAHRAAEFEHAVLEAGARVRDRSYDVTTTAGPRRPLREARHG